MLKSIRTALSVPQRLPNSGRRRQITTGLMQKITLVTQGMLGTMLKIQQAEQEMQQMKPKGIETEQETLLMKPKAIAIEQETLQMTPKAIAIEQETLQMAPNGLLQMLHSTQHQGIGSLMIGVQLGFGGHNRRRDRLMRCLSGEIAQQSIRARNSTHHTGTGLRMCLTPLLAPRRTAMGCRDRLPRR